MEVQTFSCQNAESNLFAKNRNLKEHFLPSLLKLKIRSLYAEISKLTDILNNNNVSPEIQNVWSGDVRQEAFFSGGIGCLLDPPPTPPSLPGVANVQHLYINSTNNTYLAAPVLNTIKWTEALDEVFINNSNEDPGLKWQYFGSETGVFRSYPGM